MSVRAIRFLGGLLGLVGSILVLLGFIEPWLPTNVYVISPCGPQQRGCPQNYTTATTTLRHAIQAINTFRPDVRGPIFLIIPLVLAVVPLVVSLYALVPVPPQPVLALEAAATLLGTLTLLGLCWYAAFGNPGRYSGYQNDYGYLARHLAPTLWLFLGYALIWGGWWLLARMRRAATAAKGQ